MFRIANIRFLHEFLHFKNAHVFLIFQAFSEHHKNALKKLSISCGKMSFNNAFFLTNVQENVIKEWQEEDADFSKKLNEQKRIALKNNIYSDNKSFWIYKKLKRKGFIAGKYQVCNSEQKKGNLIIKQKILPKLVHDLNMHEPNFQANYDDEKDLIELLNLSNSHSEITNLRSWEKVMPLYPLSPFN